MKKNIYLLFLIFVFCQKICLSSDLNSQDKIQLKQEANNHSSNENHLDKFNHNSKLLNVIKNINEITEEINNFDKCFFKILQKTIDFNEKNFDADRLERDGITKDQYFLYEIMCKDDNEILTHQIHKDIINEDSNDNEILTHEIDKDIIKEDSKDINFDGVSFTYEQLLKNQDLHTKILNNFLNQLNIIMECFLEYNCSYVFEKDNNLNEEWISSFSFLIEIFNYIKNNLSKISQEKNIIPFPFQEKKNNLPLLVSIKNPFTIKNEHMTAADINELKPTNIKTLENCLNQLISIKIYIENSNLRFFYTYENYAYETYAMFDIYILESLKNFFNILISYEKEKEPVTQEILENSRMKYKNLINFIIQLLLIRTYFLTNEMPNFESIEFPIKTLYFISLPIEILFQIITNSLNYKEYDERELDLYSFADQEEYIQDLKDTCGFIINQYINQYIEKKVDLSIDFLILFNHFIEELNKIKNYFQQSSLRFYIRNNENKMLDNEIIDHIIKLINLKKEQVQKETKEKIKNFTNNLEQIIYFVNFNHNYLKSDVQSDKKDFFKVAVFFIKILNNIKEFFFDNNKSLPNPWDEEEIIAIENLEMDTKLVLVHEDTNYDNEFFDLTIKNLKNLKSYIKSTKKCFFYRENNKQIWQNDAFNKLNNLLYTIIQNFEIIFPTEAIEITAKQLKEIWGDPNMQLINFNGMLLGISDIVKENPTQKDSSKSNKAKTVKKPMSEFDKNFYKNFQAQYKKK